MWRFDHIFFILCGGPDILELEKWAVRNGLKADGAKELFELLARYI
jgi:hypothetical protein